jgi:hypothetical protein
VPDEIKKELRHDQVFATAATLLALATPAFATDEECEVNLDQYNKLKVGMRYSEVVEILGCEGDKTFSAKSAGNRTDTFNWEGLYVIFSNGNLYVKGETGLRPAGVAKPVAKPIVINIDIDLTPKAKVEPAQKADPAEVGHKAIDAVPQQ